MPVFECGESLLFCRVTFFKYSYKFFSKGKILKTGYLSSHKWYNWYREGESGSKRTYYQRRKRDPLSHSLYSNLTLPYNTKNWWQRSVSNIFKPSENVNDPYGTQCLRQSLSPWSHVQRQFILTKLINWWVLSGGIHRNSTHDNCSFFQHSCCLQHGL